MRYSEPEYGVSEVKGRSNENGSADEILSLFQGKVKVGCWWFGGSEVKYQLLPRSPRLKTRVHIWIECPEPEYEPSEAKDGRVKMGPRIESYHYLRKKSKLAVGGSGGRRSIGNFSSAQREFFLRKYSG